MRILVVNPNSTASMTAKIGRAAQLVAAPGTEILAVNPPDTPASIEGYVDEALCLPGLLATIGRYAGSGVGEDVAGTVIACFDDPGLDAARALTARPVVGVCEAAVRMATLVAGRFSIVTTTSRSVPAIEHLAQRYGVARRCRVRAAAVPVLALEEPGSDARRRVAAEIARALEEDGAEAIVLGCAGMADLARDYRAEFGVPVIDGVTAAVKLVEGLAALGLTTAKRGGYAYPAPK